MPAVHSLPRRPLTLLLVLAMLASLMLVGVSPALATQTGPGNSTFSLVAGENPADPSNDTTPIFTWSTNTASATFQCSLDGAAYVACTSGYEYPGSPALTETLHTFAVQGRNSGDTGWLAADTWSWTVDVTPPGFGSFSGPPVRTNATTATIDFTSDDPDATVTCSVDAVAVDPCTPPLSLSGLAEGSHDVTYQFTDLAGNADGARGHTWVVDLTAPVTTIAGTPADAAVTNSPTMDFTFTTDDPDATTACTVEGAISGVIVDIDPCTFVAGDVPADDDYTLTVFSTDDVGNAETAQTVSWTYDSTAPGTTISSGPDAVTSVTTATFAFGSTEDPNVTYECVLDLAGAPCTTGQEYPGLADDTYTFTVTGTDPAGNADSDTRTWRVDTVDPVPAITSGPADPSNLTTATIVFEADPTPEDADAVLSCTLNAVAADCVSPVELTGLADGVTYTFEVMATDAAGNVGTDTWVWTVDLTAPGTTITGKPDADTSSTAATFTYSSPGAVAVDCKLDDAATFTPCDGLTTTSYTGLSEGSHTFTVRGTDDAGNVETPGATYTWTVDTIAPQTFITSAAPGFSADPDITFTSDAGTTFECMLAGPDPEAWAACTSPWSPAASLSDGAYTFSVRAIDAAGNVDASPATEAWTVDTSEPDTLITSAPSGTLTTSAATFTFTGADGHVSFECKLDAGAWAACTSPQNLTVADGAHTFMVRALNSIGNADSTPESRTWTVDTVGPTLTIGPNPTGTVTSSSATLTWTAGEALSSPMCRIDGGAWEACAGGTRNYTLTDGAHLFEVKASDANGNVGPTASRSWTIDTVAPNTILTSRPANGTLTTARLTFTATEVSTFECSLDAAAWTACTSPRNLSGLAVGTHTFRVRATDGAGLTDATPAVTSWRVDAPEEAQRFTDVEKGDLFAADIARLAESGVTKGCNKDGTRFCPDLNVTRGEMAAFFTRALGLPAGTKVFSDTRGHLFQANIAALERAGITRGCNSARTKFCPDDFVTRGEMAAFFTRALSLPAGTKVFSDTRGHLFQANIAALERAGITKGCNDARTKFCPDQFITRGQMAAFFARSGVLDS